MSWAEIECTWVEFQGEFSVSYLSWVWVCLSCVSGGVQFLVLEMSEMSISIGIHMAHSSKVSITQFWFDSQGVIYGLFQLVSEMWLNWLNISWLKIQRESLVQGEFLVIPLFLLSKGESFWCLHWHWWIFVADGEFLLLMANLVDLLHGVPNIHEDCRLIVLMHEGCQQLERGRLLFPVWGLECVL